MSNLAAIILAAGKGTRMKSDLPKVLHSVAGKPMLIHVLNAAEMAGCTQKIVIVGFGAGKVVSLMEDLAQTAEQKEQLGTGHAVMQAEALLKDFTGTVMVLCGDTPLLDGRDLSRFYQYHVESKNIATVLTAILPDATGYGRVIRDKNSEVKKIVEQKDATMEELTCKEINTGIYCFDCKSLFEALKTIDCNNAQGEYYLTDVIAKLVDKGAIVGAFSATDKETVVGINSRIQLAQAEKWLREKINTRLMEGGVTIVDPNTTYIDADVTIGRDTIIYPLTWLEGDTTIGEECSVGPNTRLCNVTVGNGCTLHFSYAHDAVLGKDVTVGPYVHIRPGSRLADNVKVGNFVEVKNSWVGAGTKLPHLSYIGDADIGENVNMGCGSITVNYDGKQKRRTTINDNAFVGCNSNLIAPVTIGEGAYIGAGSTINKDVPPEALSVERSKQKNIENWKKRQI